MVDALLIYPIPTKDSPVKGPATSIFYVGVSLEKEGYDVEYFDERYDSVEYLKEVLEQKPLFVGISAMTGYQLVGAEKYFKLTRKITPSSYTVFGGVHPTMIPNQCICEDFIDFIVYGEGETTIVELVKEMKTTKNFSKVDGLIWKKNNTHIYNKRRELLDLKTIVFPITDKTKKYFEYSAKDDEIFYFSSRGCPYSCRFCYNNVFNRGKWRPMPLKKLEKEIDDLVNSLDTKIKYMFLNDDWISVDKHRLREIGRILSKHNIKWGTCTRCSDLSEEIVKILEDGGCNRLLLGVESGSERVLNVVIGKKYKEGVNDIKNSALLLNNSKIKATYGFIVGTPTETKKDLKESIKLANWIHRHDKNSRISFYSYAPYPGTELYNESVKNGFKEPKTFQEWSKVSLSSENNPLAENLYYIAGLTFRGGKADATNKNFPGLKRLKIVPFEISAHIRWRLRVFTHFNLEKRIIKGLIANAVKKCKRLN